MSLYTKARKHIDMNRVKKLREEKIERKKNADEIREQIREELRNINSPEFSNWRCNLDENMTTSALMTTTLPATGDVDLVTTEQTFETSFNGNNESVSGGEVILSGSSNSIAGGEHTIYRRAMFKVDGSKSSTLKLTIAKGGGTSSWTDRDPPQNFDDDVVVNVYQSSGGPYGPSYNNANLSSGTHLINLPGQFEDLQIQIEQFAKVSATGALRITGASLQRRTPINVFVSLDSPEATSFIRTDPTMQGLSAEDRKKKLIDMLDAGDEYLLKYLGMTGSKARPSDVTMPDSWDQAAAQQGPMPTGPSGYKKPGSYDPNKIFNLAPGSLPSPNIPYTGPGRSNVPGTKDYGDVAVKVRPVQGPSTEVYYDKKMKQFVPRNSGGVALDQIRKAHYEPKGETIMEKKKKSFKDLTNKIPGYYDGKPAPLGFPMQEPPKMVNGFHPDLVDGKKIANRFNRLDPQSAKAMPPTGNPHIDKKVRAAAKKPK